MVGIRHINDIINVHRPIFFIREGERVCVRVCVCERETERERERGGEEGTDERTCVCVCNAPTSLIRNFEDQMKVSTSDILGGDTF